MAINFLFRCMIGAWAICVGYLVYAFSPLCHDMLGVCGIIILVPLAIVLSSLYVFSRFINRFISLLILGGICLFFIPLSLGAVLAAYTAGFLLTIWWVPFGKAKTSEGVAQQFQSTASIHTVQTRQSSSLSAIDNYIFACRKRGFGDALIREQLLASGWESGLVDRAMARNAPSDRY